MSLRTDRARPVRPYARRRWPALRAAPRQPVPSGPHGRSRGRSRTARSAALLEAAFGAHALLERFQLEVERVGRIGRGAWLLRTGQSEDLAPDRGLVEQGAVAERPRMGDGGLDQEIALGLA